MLVVAMLFLCSCHPSTENVALRAKSELQQKINATFKDGGVVIANIAVIREGGVTYQGQAHIDAYGSPITLRFSIIADRDSVIVDASGIEWTGLLSSARENKLKPIEGAYSSVVVTNAQISSCLPPELQRDKAILAERLEVTSPTERQGPYWFGSGCKAHLCMDEGAAWAIDSSTTKAYAIVLSQNIAALDGAPTRRQFAIYGTDIPHLPEPLLSWAQNMGMTDFNSVVVKQDFGDQ